MKRIPRLLLLPLVLVSWSCQDGDPVGVPVQTTLTPGGLIHEVDGYMFLGPIGKASVSAKFLGGLSPTVTVCKWDAANATCFANTTVANFSGAQISVSTENVYQVNWDTSNSPDIVSGETYQIVVRLEGERLGTADIAVYTSMGQAKNATGDAIALQDGRVLPIRFGIEPQALLEILDVGASEDFVIQTFTTDGGEQTATVPSGNAAFRANGTDATINGGAGTEFTLVIAEKAKDLATGRCEPSYGAPNTGGCYLYETFPSDVTFEFADGNPAGMAGVCPDSDATDAYVLAKTDDGVTTFPAASPTDIVTCSTTEITSRMPWGLRHLARLLVPAPLHAKDEGETGMVGSFSTIYWAMPVALETVSTLPTRAVPPGHVLQLSFRAVQTHGHDDGSGDVHPAAGVQVEFSLSPDGGSVSVTNGVTDSNGIVNVSWTMPVTSGARTMTATLNVGTANANPGSAASVSATVDAGVTVSGTVFYSTGGLSGVTVELVQGAFNDPALSTTTTDAQGNYSFTNVPDGTYFVKALGQTSEFISAIGFQITVAGADIIRNIDLPKNIVLLTPASGATEFTTQPQLTWTANKDAARYAIQINATQNWVLHEVGSATSASYTVQTPLSWGVNYTWQVDAYDQAGHHVGTTQSAFTLTPIQPIG